MVKPPGIPDAISRERFLEAGTHELRRMAWSGRGPITRVEVSTDDRRTFRPAVLEAPVGPYAWTPFRCTWDAGRRRVHVISSRATDASGARQPLEPYWDVQGMAQNSVERIPVQVV